MNDAVTVSIDTAPVFAGPVELELAAPACRRCLGPLDVDYFCSICGAVTLPKPRAVVRDLGATFLTFDAPTRAARLAGREV